jgi:5'(3')-deoxyribonucleotidase
MRVALDVDDVLADTFAAFEKAFGEAPDATVEDLSAMFPGTDASTVIEDAEFHLQILPIEGAASGVLWIVECGYDVFYLSSRPRGLQEASLKWLDRWRFPPLPLLCVGRDSKQEYLTNGPYDILIDDQVRYLAIAGGRGKRAIAFSNPWNQSWNGEKVESWNDLKGRL